jgi:hypothetical protein
VQEDRASFGRAAGVSLPVLWVFRELDRLTRNKKQNRTEQNRTEQQKKTEEPAG